MSESNQTAFEKIKKELDLLKVSFTTLPSVKSENSNQVPQNSSILTRIQAVQTFQASRILTREANYKTWVRSIPNTLGNNVYQYIFTNRAPNSLLILVLSAWKDFAIRTINVTIDPIKVTFTFGDS